VHIQWVRSGGAHGWGPPKYGGLYQHVALPALWVKHNVEKRHTSNTKPSDESQSTYRHTWVYDFTDVSVEDLIPDWIKSDVIRRQNVIRTRVSKGKPLPWAVGDVMVNVKEDIANRHARVRIETPDPATAIKNDYKNGNITREEAMAQLEALLA